MAQLQMKAFVRRGPIMLIVCLGIAAVAGAGAYELYLFLRYLTQAPAVADILANFTRYSIALPLVLAVVTYESASAPRVAGMQESVESHPETLHFHWRAMLIPPVLVLAIITAIYLGFKFAILIAADQVAVLGWHMVGEAGLNVVAPCVIAVLLGMAAAMHLKRYAWYAVVALFAFLIGPYAEIVPTLGQMGMAQGGWGIDLYPVYDLFRILAPDTTWAMDPLYGFPLENERWMVAGLWTFGLLALIFPALAGPPAFKARYARIALISLAAVCLVVIALPSSELRRDYRFFGGSSIVSDQAYYQMQADEHPPRVQAADFGVSRYEMELAAGRQLGATVSMIIEDDATSGAYRFTLYHGYRVDRVRGSGGRELDFEQVGDYVTVMSEEPQERLTFEYAGDGGICIANHQAVFLPGYFPYYPAPGFVRVWDELRFAPIGEISGNGVAEFAVRFRTGVDLASNLDSRDGVFEGSAVAPTFVGGLIAEETVVGHRIVFYPASGTDPGKLTRLIARLDELEQRLSASQSGLREGTVLFQMPGLTQSPFAALAVGDTLFVSGFDEWVSPDILTATMPMQLDRENLKEAFVRLAGDPAGFMETNFVSEGGAVGMGEGVPSAEEIAELEAARRGAQSDYESIQEYVYPSKRAVYRLLAQKVKDEGEDQALRDTYAYLSSDSPISELQFLSESNSGEAR